MPKTYRVGIVGRTGRGNYGHDVDVAFTKLPNVEIVAVADDDEKGRAAAQKRTGAKQVYVSYRQMIEQEKPDIVAVCQGRKITEMIAAIFESQRVGSTVELPLTTRVNPLTLLK